ncbi:unnamed protein product [Trifolium pratense]|uniref:Uncharacterized protein n=1 Tax=Trifolium pratense TaxID=57577 RepID=A0ACB0LSE5_TRIPR|nr:unnamed protein product [Trifolium pratense]
MEGIESLKVKDESTFKSNPFLSSSVSGLKERPLTTQFHGWRYQQEKWFSSLQDQEMREVEKMLARKKLTTDIKTGGDVRTSMWMDIFIEGSEIEHEAFLATWLSIFVFPNKGCSKLCAISDKKLYFPARLFEADVTTRYANWWKQSILGRGDFVQNIVRKKRNPGSRKHRPFVGNGNGSDDGSKPKTRKVDEFYADVHHENSVPDCSQMTKHNTVIPSMYVEDSNHVSKDYIELSVWSLEEGFKDANGSKEAEISSDRVYISETQGKSCNYAIRNKVSSLNKVTAAQHDVQFLSDNVAQVQE